MKNAKALRAAGWHKAYSRFGEELMKSSQELTKAAQELLLDATEDFLEYVQENKDKIPYYTGNLHDSIATAVCAKGHVVRARYMPKEARRPQTAAGRKRIVGEQEAVRAVRLYRPPKKSGVTAVLFVAVPYAEGANRSGTIRRVFRGREYLTRNHNPGYLQWLEENFTITMDSAIRLLRYYKSSGGIPANGYAQFRAAKKGTL